MIDVGLSDFRNKSLSPPFFYESNLRLFKFKAFKLVKTEIWWQFSNFEIEDSDNNLHYDDF